MAKIPQTQENHRDFGLLALALGADGQACLELRSGWRQGDPEAAVSEALALLRSRPDLRQLSFREAGLDRTDSLVVSTVLHLIVKARERGLSVEVASLPPSLRPLVELALAVAPTQHPEPAFQSRLEQIGRKAHLWAGSTERFITFLGELITSLGRLLTGRARMRWRDFWVILQDCGVSALPIVSLLAILTGTILGFIGAVQLRKFGATIYMTDLVGLAMAREMACIMTGVIMSGRTGAAFAAQIGSMTVNQEVDALRTFGLSPVEFLVLPRTVALFVMMPLLTLYANVLGWFGGYLVALPMEINPAEYWDQLTESLTLAHIGFGLSKSFFFGLVVATTGCYYGLRSGRSSAAVGEAATKAVVAGITWIIVLDALFAFMDELISG